MMPKGRRLEQSILLATKAFSGITRKGTDIPYVTHLFCVMANVAEHGGDEDLCIAAVLHDYLEDIPGSSVSQLAAQFGDRVAGIVLAVSDSTVLPKPPWRDRKERFLARLGGESEDVKLICAADKLHNVRSLLRDLKRDGISTLDRFSGGRDGTLWYYTQVVKVLSEGWDHPLCDELILVVQEFERVVTAGA
jgi:(p)ppGpp synthase/HD superfamily hydrolase